MANPIILIPARMSSTRLPGKPMIDLNGLPMILQVVNRAKEADIGRVVVATDDAQIHECVISAGNESIMTRDDHTTGSDRIFEALIKIDADGAHDQIINIQGDLPTLDKTTVQRCASLLTEGEADISTVVAEITVEEERTNPNVVKAIGTPIGKNHFRALYFTRATAPTGEGPLYHHIGLYGYRREALERFVSLAPAPLEQRERLEQLRALENGMRIDFAVVDTVPLGVDTPADLDKARAQLTAMGL